MHVFSQHLPLQTCVCKEHVYSFLSYFSTSFIRFSQFQKTLKHIRCESWVDVHNLRNSVQTLLFRTNTLHPAIFSRTFITLICPLISDSPWKITIIRPCFVTFLFISGLQLDSHWWQDLRLLTVQQFDSSFKYLLNVFLWNLVTSTSCN